MAIAPVLASMLSGSSDDKAKISLNVKISAEGCCGNVACCSSNVNQQQTIDKKRITFNAAAGEGKGGFDAKQESVISRLFKACCCCCKPPEKTMQENIHTRSKFEDALTAKYGELIAGQAINRNCLEKGKTWETMKENADHMSFAEYNRIIRLANDIREKVRNSPTLKPIIAINTSSLGHKIEITEGNKRRNRD